MFRRDTSAIRFGSIIVTYRCNARCHMCNTWKYPSAADEEVGLDVYRRLPPMHTVNITGGEPFMRDDLADIVGVLRQKSKRLVISSNGYFTEKILDLFARRRDIGIRISIEGLPAANDALRGIADGFDHGIRTLIALDRMGVRDIGFATTVCDDNAGDLLKLYHLSKMMGLEFATAALHNSFYFHKFDNAFPEPEKVISQLDALIKELLRSRRPKDWFRAYFNHGLINYIRRRRRLLPCRMGYDSFFLDPFGRVLACNVLDESMGNLRETPFDEIWQGQGAGMVRRSVDGCCHNCWMVGSVGQQMRRHLWRPLWWVIRRKFFPGGLLRRQTKGAACNRRS